MRATPRRRPLSTLITAALTAAVILIPAPALATDYTCNEAGLDAAITAGGGPHTFDCAGPTTITTTGTKTIATNLILDGEGLLTISGNNSHGVFVVHPGVSFEAHSLTIANGRTTFGGGGIFADDSSSVTLTNTTVTGNAAAGGAGGGGIYAFRATLTLTNSAIIGNTAGFGGGIGAQGAATMTLTNTTVAANAAEDGGGIYAGDDGPSVTLTNSAITANAAEWSGGGLYAGENARVTLIGSAVTANTAWIGGGIYIFPETLVFSVTSSVFVSNAADDTGSAIFSSSTGGPYPLRVRSLTGSCIVGNTDTAVVMGSGISGNWWGDASGPSGTGSGTGDSVFTGAFGPWSTVPLAGCPNPPPVADAGSDQVAPWGGPGTAAGLDGSGSFDPEGEPLTYLWAAPPGVTLDDPTSAEPVATFPGPGTYVFTLVVSDGPNDSAPDTMTFTITNSTPVANAGLDEEILWAGPGTSATLDGSGSFDPDGDPLTYAWTPTGGATLDDPTLLGPTATFPAPGTYEFTLVVNDGTVDSAPDTVTVTVDGPPTANANGPYVVQFLEDIQLDGSASSDFEGPLTYAWTVTGGTLDDPTAAEPTYTAPFEPGTYTATLTVTDSFGSSDTSTAEIHVFDPIVYSPWTGPGVRTDGVCEILIWWDNAHVLLDTDGDPDDWSISGAARFYAYDTRVDREISSTSQTTFMGDAGDSVVLEQQWRTESWQRFANQVRLDDVSLVVTEDDGRAGNDRGTLSVSPNELITCGETVHLTLTTLVLPGAARGQVSDDTIGLVSVDLTITTVPVAGFHRPV